MKLTLDTFKSNLKDNKYKNAGGARKALGKAQDISKNDKETLQAAINKHFGETATKPAAKKAAPKKAPKVKTAAKKAPKAAAKPAAKKEKAPKGSVLKTFAAKPVGNTGNMTTIAAEQLLAGSLQALAVIKNSPVPGVELVPTVETLQDNIVYATKVLRKHVESLEAAAKTSVSKPTVVKPVKTATANGAPITDEKAAKDFHDSLPGAAASS